MRFICSLAIVFSSLLPFKSFLLIFPVLFHTAHNFLLYYLNFPLSIYICSSLLYISKKQTKPFMLHYPLYNSFLSSHLEQKFLKEPQNLFPFCQLPFQLGCHTHHSPTIALVTSVLPNPVVMFWTDYLSTCFVTQ